MSLSLLDSYQSDSSHEDDETKHQQESQRNAKPPQPQTNTSSDVPPDLARELKAAHFDSSDINILDIDPTPITNQPHPSAHIPQHALRKNAMRLARHITKDSVSTIARRKHQITALAAEAVALQVAQDTLPGASRPTSRINRNFK